MAYVRLENAIGSGMCYCVWHVFSCVDHLFAVYCYLPYGGLNDSLWKGRV